MRAAHISGLNSKINRLHSLPSKTRCASSTMVVPTPPAAFDTPALSLIRDLNQKYSKVRSKNQPLAFFCVIESGRTGFVQVLPLDHSPHASNRCTRRTKPTSGLPRWPCRFVLALISSCLQLSDLIRSGWASAPTIMASGLNVAGTSNLGIQKLV